MNVLPPAPMALDVPTPLPENITEFWLLCRLMTPPIRSMKCRAAKTLSHNDVKDNQEAFLTGQGHSHSSLLLAQDRKCHIFLDLPNSVASDFNSSLGLVVMESNIGKSYYSLRLQWV